MVGTSTFSRYKRRSECRDKPQYKMAALNDGRRVFAACGRELQTFDIVSEGDAVQLRLIGKTRAPGTIQGLSPLGRDIVLAVENQSQSTVYLFNGEEFSRLVTLDTPVSQILTASRDIFVLTQGTDTRLPEVQRIDVSSGKLMHTRSVSRYVNTLRLAGKGQVVSINPVLRRIHQIDMSESDCYPGRLPPGRDGGSDRGRSDGEPVSDTHGCCCCGKQEPGNQEPSDSNNPSRQPPRDPPREHCEDGDDGIVDGCFVYIVAGSSIIVRNLCDPARPVCEREVHSRIQRLELVGSTLFALTRDGRTIETFDRNSLRLVAQYPAPGESALLLPAPAANRVLAIAADLSAITVLDAVPAHLPFEAGFEALPVSERVFEGVASAGNTVFNNGPEPSLATQTTPVLIVPFTHGGQNYSGPGAEVYADALRTMLEPNQNSSLAQQAPLAKVIRYYEEQSYQQQNFDFTVFGAETSAFFTGPPVEIDNRLEDYFYPPFAAGGLEAFVGSGPAPSPVRFRGNEEVEITAFSAINAQGANAHHFDLRFPAAMVRIDLNDEQEISILQGAAPWDIEYENEAGVIGSITLDPSILSQNLNLEFNSEGGAFDAEVSDLRDTLQTMIDASPAAGDFDDVDVVWGQMPGEALGRIYVRFSFSGAISYPRIRSMSTDAAVANFFGVPEADVDLFRGWADPSRDLDDESDSLSDYLNVVLDLAEIEAAVIPEKLHIVDDPILGGARVEYTQNSAATRISLSNPHGAAPGRIEPVATANSDPLGLGNASAIEGSDFSYDDRNSMEDKTAFFTMFYGKLVETVQSYLGGAPAGGWKEFADFLGGFKTVYAFPVDVPPGASPTAWSIDMPPVGVAKRAFVHSSNEPYSDPAGVGEPASVRWGLNFQSFDDTGSPSVLAKNTVTFAHELGHTLELGDQYYSEKFDPTLRYLGALDLMGESSTNWPHFSGYHKAVLNWFGENDILLLERPGEGDSRDDDFILLPIEWWDSSLQDAARDAFNQSADLAVTPLALCDLGGDGGVLGSIEARAPSNEFSLAMGPNGLPGRVMIQNVLDYGQTGRYGQVISDAVDLPPDVIDGLLRFRRRMHLLRANLQFDETFDFADARGFPYDGLTVRVTDEASIMVDGNSVPVYRCQTRWTGGLGADVGFSSSDEEWRSPDIAIDYLGNRQPSDEELANDPEVPRPGENSWSEGQPLGVGEKPVIPPSGTEPHRVRVRVRNFGPQTVRDVMVHLYLRDPGGGGELNGHEPYDTQEISILPPVAEFGPEVIDFTWDVPAGQEPHVCWRAEIGEFRIGEGANSRVVVTDAAPGNNWAQQNIFDAYVPYSSPPEPLESRFSVTNDGPFVEWARLVPEGLPLGVTLRVRPRELRVPAYSTRVFTLRFEFDEAMIHDPCRRDLDVLIRCLRREEHYEEPWGASMFRIRLKRKTEIGIQGTWFGNALSLNGALEPGIGVGRVSIRLDFGDGEAARWISADLNPGGIFDASYDTAGIDHGSTVDVSAHYHGSDVYAPSISEPVRIQQYLPEG